MNGYSDFFGKTVGNGTTCKADVCGRMCVYVRIIV